MFRYSSVVLLAVIAGVLNEPANAFSGPSHSRSPVTTRLAADEKESTCRVSRREALFGVVATAFLAAAAPEPAAAKYSDYARREKDWQSRSESGDIKYSSARDLRAQLQEIAPMNTSNSKIFCPNGPSANVSPLMENKCGDRMATPSVYGRQNDVMGNSVPGFKDGYAWGPGQSSSMSAAVGGFPTYKENEWQVREYGK